MLIDQTLALVLVREGDPTTRAATFFSESEWQVTKKKESHHQHEASSFCPAGSHW
jgi:hypothetical protein